MKKINVLLTSLFFVSSLSAQMEESGEESEIMLTASSVSQTFSGGIGITIPSTASNSAKFIDCQSDKSSSTFTLYQDCKMVAYSPVTTGDWMSFKTSSSPNFAVSKSGVVSGAGLVVYPTTINSNAPHLSLIYDNANSRFKISTESYMNSVYDIYFAASNYYFDKGDMYVNGKITCKDELKVEGVQTAYIKTDDIVMKMDHAADYVFDQDYKLVSLESVEDYIKKNKHLPGIPSALQQACEGVHVAEMGNLLLEKIEELTLYMIELKKENEELKQRLDSIVR